MSQSRLLLVNDEPDNLQWLSLFLETEGYTVQTALGGKEAIEAVHRQPPDALLLDVMMPQVDGLSVARALRSEPHLASLVIVLTTGRYLEKQEWQQAGVDAYLQKPIDGDELVRQLRQLLDKQTEQ